MLSGDILKDWLNYLKSLEEMKIVSVPRYLFKFTKDIVTNVTLHGFCDSSVKAYCAIVFIHYVSSDSCFFSVDSLQNKSCQSLYQAI